MMEFWLILCLFFFFSLFCSQMSRYSSLRVQLREIWLNIYKYIYILKQRPSERVSTVIVQTLLHVSGWKHQSWLFLLVTPVGERGVGRAVYLLRSRIPQPEKKIQQKEQISQTLDWLFSSLKDRKNISENAWEERLKCKLSNDQI